MSVYVETDFLVALVKEDDWLEEAVLQALDDHEDLHSSILAYAELLVLLYDREESGYDVDAPRALVNLLELVPVEPQAHEEAVLAAATYLEEFDLTPVDALHAGVATVRNEPILSTEGDYETVGIERIPLEDAA